MGIMTTMTMAVVMMMVTVMNMMIMVEVMMAVMMMITIMLTLRRPLNFVFKANPLILETSFLNWMPTELALCIPSIVTRKIKIR